MQIASILSDLTSLRVCDHSAAIALVSVHKVDSTLPAATGSSQSSRVTEKDPDMQRATDLVELHYGVKMNHMQGEDAGLRQARRDVDQVLRKLDGKAK
ncbi:hypothetical protein P7C71_g42, partial [Lecanoromycetidae sp. Uapishka_2]